jgi:hypothetical protein
MEILSGSLRERAKVRGDHRNPESRRHREAENQRKKAVRRGDLPVNLFCDFLLVKISHGLSFPFRGENGLIAVKFQAFYMLRKERRTMPALFLMRFLISRDIRH